MRLIRLTLLIGLLCLIFPGTAYAAEPGPILLNPITQDAPPTGGEEEAAAKPDTFTNIENVLGTLGVFSAFMLILAVGAEVTIDSLKVIAGFKSKPTAMETVNQLRSWLPGSLEELGAGEAAVSKLKLTLNAMAGHMGKVDEATEAIKTVDEWLPDYLKNLSVDKLQTLLTNDENIQKLKEDLGKKIGPGNVAMAVGWLRGALATLTATSVKDFTSQVREMLKDIPDLDNPDDVAKKIQDALDTALPGDIQDLAQSGQKLQAALDKVKEALNDPKYDAVLAQVNTWLTGAVTTLETNESTVYTAAMTNLMQAVEDRRDNIHSWIGKVVRGFFRWLKGHLSLETNPQDQSFKAKIKRQTQRLLDRIDGFRSGDHIIPPLNPSNIARILLERDSAHRQEEVSRLRWLRIISVIVGMTLAVMLKVDVGNLLQPIISVDLHNTLASPAWEMMCKPLEGSTMVLSMCTNDVPTGIFLPAYNFLHMATIGMLLSGLAASAGSAFWHDMLDRLQAAKKATSDIKDLAAQIQAMEQGK